MTPIVRDTLTHAVVETRIDKFQVIDKKFQKLIDSIEERLINVDRILGFTLESNTHYSDFSKTTYLYGNILLNRISELEKQLL